MCTALFCYCWRRTTTEGPLSLAFAALSFGVIVGVAGELSCEGKRSERAAARHAVDDSGAGEKEEVSVLPPPRRCRRQTDDSSSPSVSQTSNVGAVVRVATAGERSEEEEGAELAERKRSSAGLGGHGSEEGEQSRVK